MSEGIDWEAVVDMLYQLSETLERTQRSFSMVSDAEFFYASTEGREKLDAIGMKLLAVGEILKKIDRKTNKSLFGRYAGIDWTGFIGLRDVIAHDYFNLNPIKIFDICSKEIEPLLSTVRQMINDLQRIIA